MRVTRIYTDQPLAVGTDILLEQQPSRHLLTVLRLQPGTPVALFNGKGGEFSAELLGASGKLAKLKVTGFDEIDRESPLQIHLGIGLSRGERFDWVVQKATELGVSKITPLLSERTEVKLKVDRAEKKLRHWQQIIISACEQSGRNRLPEIVEPLKYADWLTLTADLKLVTYPTGQKRLSDMTNYKPGSVNVLIGPEGGLSDEEIDMAFNENFLPLAIGPRILRTETAPLAVISLLQLTWGDM